MTNFTQGTAFIDGQYLPISEAKISILDWGFLHSDATYDVVHVWNGKFFRLDDHFERFYSGMKKLHLEIPYSKNELQTILSHCVKQSGLNNAYVEMITTRGQPEPGSRDPRRCNNQFIAFAIPFVWVCKPKTSLNLFISERQRIPTESVDPMIKNYHWLDLVMGQYEAFSHDSETVVLLDQKGNVTEGPGFNLFVVKNKIISTPANGVLQGITRKTTIELARAQGFDINEKDVTPEQVRYADEVFATSTAGGIMPITAVDNKLIADGEMGETTKALQSAYWLLHDDPKHTIAIDYSINP